MSQNLVKGGYDVVVWNRTKSKADEVTRDLVCDLGRLPKSGRRTG